YEGNDTFVFNLGDGQDTIAETFYDQGGKEDVLSFGAGIDASKLRFGWVGNDLVVHYSDKDGITIKEWFTDDRKKIELVKFADGKTATVASLIERGLSVTGTTANDNLVGNVGSDTLFGGIGNDTLSGGTGNDTYVFERGNGVDIIVENDSTVGNNDTVQFKDVKSTDVTAVQKVGSNLVIKYGASDQLTVEKYFDTTNAVAYRVERFIFSDKVSWTNTQIDTKVAPAAAPVSVSRSKRSLDEPEIAVCYRGGPGMSTTRQPEVAVCTMGSRANGVDQQLNAMVSAMSAFAPQGAAVLGHGPSAQDIYVPVLAPNRLM
ncbi:calcium-binding protein, partial [Chitinimonas sp. BJB300]